MKEYQYKCVPVPSIIETGEKGKAFHSDAVKEYEKIINEGAKGGWELVNIDNVSSKQKPGCWDGLFGGKSEVLTIKMLVYRKEVIS
ncbi:MAG TPA: DUF4177 domain-containing protein [Bacteroidia bacterium]|nr:DUF4177 domain-containing protein [Bacteroidia bacterium]